LANFLANFSIIDLFGSKFKFFFDLPEAYFDHNQCFEFRAHFQARFGDFDLHLRQLYAQPIVLIFKCSISASAFAISRRCAKCARIRILRLLNVQFRW
jgi:hypothetical protein